MPTYIGGLLMTLGPPKPSREATPTGCALGPLPGSRERMPDPPRRNA
jgi:hypothetical protein